MARIQRVKAVPVHYEFEDRYEDPESPHLSLYYHDDKANPPEFDPDHRHNHRGRPRNPNRPAEIPGLFRAAINIKSRDDETRLAYFVRHDFVNHPIAEKLANLAFGFHPIAQVDELDGKGLDYIRGSLFPSQKGRVLPHDIPGANNDLIDVLKPEVKKAIQAEATIFVFGSMFNTRNGIHNVHMNQGNIEDFEQDDGVFQDGGLLIKYHDHWTGVFLAFASQAVRTDDTDGHALRNPLVTWADVKSVTLANLTNHRVSLASWRFHNSVGQTQDLPRHAALDSQAIQKFEVPNCPLSNTGDTITLLNEKGLRVDGVSYGWKQGQQEGRPIIFV
ncbi:O-methyltransferase [Aspergillus violaceofuscus CBS 115571]|uniref:O-methyltransferase n=1 Tax=Aspergillus violaceofuscus (strain CBS 115571) TaxID=1450538 RepID=A0A2V5H9R9_ASPV1|nr:O-methyltransferase [Aspergillus violaceofuscus CBS 115571]